MSRLRIGSLCTGYGGLDMAVEAVLGGELAWVADNDPGAAGILAHRFPGVPNLGDVTTVDWGAVEPVDVLCAGRQQLRLECALMLRGALEYSRELEGVGGVPGHLVRDSTPLVRGRKAARSRLSGRAADRDRRAVPVRRAGR